MTHSLVFPARRAAALVSACAAVLVLAAATEPFHLHLVKSAPAPNAVVGAAPDSIRLWFSQPPELGVTSVKVTGPANAIVPLAPLAKRDSALVIAPVSGKMAAGAYTVAWRTMSKDGHVVRGTFGFKVAATSGP
jgi:methionine-rich copper-binding protein CopC